MFQVVDDLLDVTQSTEHVGKSTGKDSSAGKLTFPSVVGVEGSRTEVERLRRAATDALVSFGPQGRTLAQLAGDLAVRTK